MKLTFLRFFYSNLLKSLTHATLRILSFVIFSLSLMECKTKTTIEIIELPALRASAIDNADSVYAYFKKYKDTHQQIAESYFKKGIDEQDERLEKAIYYIKRSITLHPVSNSYKTLGTLLEKAGRHREAANIFGFLSYPRERYVDNNQTINLFIFDQPDEEMFYGYFVNTWLGYGYFPFETLHDVKLAGLSVEDFKEKIIADTRVNLDTSGTEYKNLKFSLMSDVEMEEYRNSSTLFKDFLASFKEKSNSFQIDNSNVNHFKYNHGLEMEGYNENYFFSTYLQEAQENKDKWYTYNFNYLCQINDSVNVVTYAIDSSEMACPVEMRHIYHRLVTYGKSGKILDSEIVAYQSGEDFATMKYENGQIVKKVEKRIWKKPYYKQDFDNEIIKIELVSEEVFKVLEDGAIVPEKGESISTF